MEVLDHIRLRMERAFWPAIIIAVVSYFSYHTLEGRYGLFALWELEEKIALAQIEADQLANTRALLELKTSRLRPESIDPELLGEQSRRLLGFIGENEYVILLPKE